MKSRIFVYIACGLTAGFLMAAVFNSAIADQLSGDLGLVEAGGGAFTADTSTTAIAPSTAPTLSQATGNEMCYDFSCTVNKATSGFTYGIYHDFTDTASPNAHYFLILLNDADTKFYVDENGVTEADGNIVTDGNFQIKGGGYLSTTSNGNVGLAPNGTGKIEYATGALVACAALPAAGTQGRSAFVTDATASDDAALCCDDGSAWVICDGSGDACCP